MSSSLKHVLFRSPWIPYNTKFIQSRIVLTYPENAIFTAQYAQHLAQLDVYRAYPYAEKMDLRALDRIDWTKALIVFNRDLQLLFAPEPVQELVRLDRRLHYREAEAAVLEPFRFWPLFRVFRRQWLGLLLLFFVYGSTCWLVSARYTSRSWARSNTAGGYSGAPGR